LNQGAPEVTKGSTPIDYLPQILDAIWQKRVLLLIIILGATAIATIWVMLLPPIYRAQTIILPELEKSKIGELAGLSQLAAVATGVEVPFARLYPTIITSEAVLNAAILHKYNTKRFDHPVDLLEYWGLRDASPRANLEGALGRIRNQVMQVTLEPRTNVVKIVVDAGEPQLAADLANEITSQFDYYTRQVRKTNASEQRKFIEQRLKEMQDELKKSEEKLKRFREENRRVSDSPQLMLEQERLMRDVSINTTLFTELKKQFELAKIQEVKDIPVINILESASPPAGKVGPKKRATIIVTFVISLIVSLLGVVLWCLRRDQISVVLRMFNEKFPVVQVLGRKIRL
jgi:uncharacterized protein involved in exopolysaccharide biosynthesis